MTDDTKPADLPEPVGVIGTQVGGVHWTVWDGKNTHTAVSKDSTTAMMFKSLPLGTLLYAAPTAPQPAEPPIIGSVDVERMLAECIPGGSTCDPQQVADSIRRYLNAWTAEPRPETVPEWTCWCDEQGIGDPGVNCGDCPRDYGHKVAAPQPAGPQDMAVYQAIADNYTAPQPEPALQRFTRLVGEREIQDPVERLRAFCSLAMRGQDWIDCEPFFDAIAAEQLRVAPAPPPRVPLSDKEVFMAVYGVDNFDSSLLRVARAIERAHGIGEQECQTPKT